MFPKLINEQLLCRKINHERKRSVQSTRAVPNQLFVLGLFTLLEKNWGVKILQFAVLPLKLFYLDFEESITTKPGATAALHTEVRTWGVKSNPYSRLHKREGYPEEVTVTPLSVAMSGSTFPTIETDSPCLSVILLDKMTASNVNLRSKISPRDHSQQITTLSLDYHGTHFSTHGSIWRLESRYIYLLLYIASQASSNLWISFPYSWFSFQQLSNDIYCILSIHEFSTYFNMQVYKCREDLISYVSHRFSVMLPFRRMELI